MRERHVRYLWRYCLCCAVLDTASGLRVPPAKSAAGSKCTELACRRRAPRLARLRAPPPRCGVLDDLTQEAEDSWLARYLPQKDGDGRQRRQKFIAEQPVMFTTDAGQEPTFDFDRWEVHRSNTRYGRLVLGVLFGKTTQRIVPVVLGVGLFSSLVFAYNNIFLTATQLIAIKARYPELQLPLTPFELTAPVLGLLLVFRTDTAYERFDSGAQLAWEITASMRSLMRRLAAYTSPTEARSPSTQAFSDAEREAAEDLITASLMVHGWIMSTYLRGPAAQQQPMEAMQSKLLRTALGADVDDVDDVNDVVDDDAASGGGGVGGGGAPPGEPTPSPYLWISAITMGISQRLPGLTDQERIALDDLLVTVSADLAKCEKLISTPIPLGYTRSSVRFLWIWLTLCAGRSRSHDLSPHRPHHTLPQLARSEGFPHAPCLTLLAQAERSHERGTPACRLPFALSRTFGDFSAGTWWEDKPLAELPVLLVAMVFISFIFLSIEDIAVQIEEPFAILPLDVQHKWLVRDAEQTRWLMRYSNRAQARSARRAPKR